MPNKNCSICHTEFICDLEKEDHVFPDILPTEFKKKCCCQSCLAQAIVKQIDASIKLNGPQQMVEIASQYRKQDGFIEHIDYTIEKGNYVFSQWYHLKRGTCCGSGCKNCPYST